MFFYYDFYIGYPNIDVSAYIFHSVKIAARSPRQAIKIFLGSNKLHNNTDVTVIKIIDEYIIKKKRGNTIVQFQKQCSYGVSINNKGLHFQSFNKLKKN